VITISPRRPVGRNLGTISFASTLYLCPILDLLLAGFLIDGKRATSGTSGSLGKRHKHGNNLDPSKLVIVRFSLADDHYWWVIADQGCGFNPPLCHADPTQYLPLNKQKVVGGYVFSTRF